jgi:hypothetical protein
LNSIEQKFRLLNVADGMKIEYASQQLQGPVGIWWYHYRSTLSKNDEVVWDQFKEAFRGHYIPSGLMAIKHTEFMKLTQGDKSVTEYWHDFIRLSRYASDFVNTDAKRIASFKRELCLKLMKTMCTSKCATFNEFVSYTLLHDNCNAVHAASKCHKIASEARASQSNTFIMVTSYPQSSDVSTRYHPYHKKGHVKKSNVEKGKSNVPPSKRLCWNCITLGHWAKDCPHPQKNLDGNVVDVCKGHVKYTTVEQVPTGEIITTGAFLVNCRCAI